MSVNSHARPGDMGVVVAGNTQLHEQNPDATYGHHAGDHRLQAGAHCVILNKVPAGSAKLGNVFLVFVEGRVGWLWNHDLMVWDDLA